MEWKKVSPGLGDLLEEVIGARESVRKTMFGCPAWFVNGNMFAGAHADRIFLRLSEEDKTDLFDSLDEAGPFEPMPGRVMREYAALPESVFENRAVLERWIERSYRHVRSLPEKKGKKGT